jgi:hypothetical protein
MPLTTQQIEVLARFDGWEYNDIGWFWKEGYKTYDDSDAKKFLPEYFTSPGVLIEMRLKIKDKCYDFDLYTTQRDQLDDLILSADYTAAAIKTSEIIQKLEA